MQILICTFGFIPELHGVSLVAYHHAREFARLGHEVVVATAHNPVRNITHHELGISIKEFKISGNAQLRSRYRGEIGNYIDYIASFEGDIICCHCWQTWVTDLAVRAFKQTKAKKILISHGVSANSHFNDWKSIANWLLWRPYVYFYMPQIMKSFDHIIFLSNRVDKDRFYDRYLADELGLRNYSIIPNGIEIDDFDVVSDSFRMQYGIEKTQLLFLCIGAFSELKNQKLVVNAFIKAKIKNSMLVLIGNKKNTYSKMLTKLWLESHKDESAHLLILEHISRRDIIAAHKAADIFINGSKSEYFPLVILESMASATPFVSTEVGCVPDLPGGFTARSESQMINLLHRLAQNAEQRRELGNAGRKACINKYSWKIIGQQYNRLFKQLHNDFSNNSNRRI